MFRRRAKSLSCSVLRTLRPHWTMSAPGVRFDSGVILLHRIRLGSRPAASNVVERKVHRPKRLSTLLQVDELEPATALPTEIPERPRTIARGNRRRESVLSNQHRLLGRDTRRRAVRRCQSDRVHQGVGEVARGVNAGHAGFAALVDLEGDAEGRIDRGEAQ